MSTAGYPESRVFISSMREWFAVGFLWSIVSPIVSHVGHGLKLAWVLYAIWLFLMYYKRPHALAKTINEARRCSMEYSMSLVWWYVILLNILFSHGLTGMNQLAYCTTWVMVLFMELSLRAQYDGSIRRVATKAVVVITVECLWSLPRMLAMPTLARLSTGGPPEYAAKASLADIGDYGYYVALAMVVPILLGLLTSVRSRLARLFYLFLTVGVALTVSQATFMGAFLLMAGGATLFTILSWTRSRTRKHSWGLVVLVAVAVIVWQTSISHTVQGSFVANKVASEIANIRVGGLQDETTGRVQLAMLSIASFEDSPLVGVGPYTTVRRNSGLYVLIGGHSSWLDQLAEYGLFGFLPLAAFLLLHARRALRVATSRSTTNEAVAHLAVIAAYIVGGIFNPVLFVPSIMVVVFMLAPAFIPMTSAYKPAIAHDNGVASDRTMRGMT